MALPTLETERLILRPFELPDAPDVQRLAGDPAVAEMTLNIPHPYPDGAAEQFIAFTREAAERGDHFTFAVVQKADSALVGCVGLSVTPAHKKAELGYWIGKPYWGRGYATEAGKAVLRFGFAQAGLNRIYARYFVQNPASARVQEKLGMTYEGTLRQDAFKWGKYVDSGLTSLLRAEFDALS